MLVHDVCLLTVCALLQHMTLARFKQNACTARNQTMHTTSAHAPTLDATA